MKRVFLAGLIVFLIVMLSSCSTVRVKPLAPGDTTTEGIRVYQPEPFLLVGKDGTASIVYLPDLSTGYAITQTDGLGGKKLKVTLANGWMLTEVGSETGAIPDKIVDLLASSIASMKDVKGTTTPPPFGLYRIVREGDGYKLQHIGP